VSAKEKLRQGKPLTEKDMQELQKQGLASPPLTFKDETGVKFSPGSVYKEKIVHDLDGTERRIIVQQLSGDLPVRTQTVEHTPHYIDTGLFVEVTENDDMETLKLKLDRAKAIAKERNRNQVLLDMVDAINHIYNFHLEWSSPQPTILEHKQKALDNSITENQQVVNAVNEQLELCKSAEETKKRMEEKIRGDRMVAKGHPRTDWDNISPEAQAEINEEVENEMKRHTKNFEALEKAVPLLQEILDIYEGALKTKQANAPSENQIKNAHKTLENLAKNAGKIIKKLQQLNHVIIYNPNEKAITEASELLKTFWAVEAEFNGLKKQFDIEFDFPSLPILQNSIKKRAHMPKQPKPEIRKHLGFLGR